MVGSLIAILLFVATISFLFTTPGVAEPAGGGFPALSLAGEFLLKDIPLLGLSFWTLADSLRAVERQVASAETAATAGPGWPTATMAKREPTGSRLSSR